MKPLLTEYTSIEKLAAEYEDDGYVVTIHPSTEQLPSALRQFRPDLIARRGDDNIIVKVKSRGALVTESDLVSIAERVAKLQGWRLELHVVEAPKHARGKPLDPMSSEDVLRRLDSARALLKSKDEESALVVAWSAFEAVLRQLSLQADIEISPWNATRAAKQLVTVGVLTRSDYDLFIRGLDARNRAVHGSSIEKPVAPLVRSVIAGVKRLSPRPRKLRQPHQ